MYRVAFKAFKAEFDLIAMLKFCILDQCMCIKVLLNILCLAVELFLILCTGPGLDGDFKHLHGHAGICELDWLWSWFCYVDYRHVAIGESITSKTTAKPKRLINQTRLILY